MTATVTRAVSVPLVLVCVTVLAALGVVDGATVIPFFTAVLGFAFGTATPLASEVVRGLREGHHQEHS